MERNMISIDTFKTIHVQNKDYKSIANFIYSQALCPSQRSILENTLPKNAYRAFDQLFPVCYTLLFSQQLESTLRTFMPLKYKEMLIQTNNQTLYYVTRNTNLILGIDPKTMQGENQIGEILMKLRNELIYPQGQVEYIRRQEEEDKQAWMNKITWVHLQHLILTRFLETHPADQFNSPLDALLFVSMVSYLESFFPMEEIYNEYEKKHQTTENFMDEMKRLLLSIIPEKDKQGYLDMYNRGQFSLEEMREIRNGKKSFMYLPSIIFSVQSKFSKQDTDQTLKGVQINQSTKNDDDNNLSQSTIQSGLDEESKYILLTDFIEYRLKQTIPDQKQRDEYLQLFLVATPESKLSILADQLVEQYYTKQLPQELYDILKQRIRLLSFIHPLFSGSESKIQSTSRMNQSKNKVAPVAFRPIPAFKLPSSLIIREKDIGPNQSPLSLTFPYSIKVQDLDFPTLVHLALVQVSFYDQLDIPSLQVRRQAFTIQTMKSNQAQNELFRPLDDCILISSQFVLATKRKQMLQSLREAIHERLFDPVYRQELRTFQGKIKYQSYDSFLGIRTGKQGEIIGQNKAGKYLEKIRKQLQDEFITKTNLDKKNRQIILPETLNNPVIQSYLVRFTRRLVEFIGMFGDFVFEPRKDFDPIDPLTTTPFMIQYIIKEIGATCFVGYYNYPMPVFYKQLIQKTMEQSGKHLFTSRLYPIVWEHILQMVALYQKFLLDLSDTKKQEFLDYYDQQAIQQVGVDQIYLAWIHVQSILYKFVSSKEYLEQYTFLFMLGVEHNTQFNQTYKNPTIHSLIEYIQNHPKLKKRIHLLADNQS